MSALFTPEQEAEITRIAEIRAAQMIGQALHGAAQRIASAIVGSPVVLLPLLHMPDLVAEPVRSSCGNADDLSASGAA